MPRELLPAHSARWKVLVLFILWAFAVAQPVYDQLSQHDTFLFDLGVNGSALLLIIGVLSLALPAVLSAVVLGMGVFSTRLGAWSYRGAQGLLWLCLALQMTQLLWVEFNLPMSIAGVFLAVMGAVAMTWLSQASVWMRRCLAAASVGVVLFPAMFVLHPGVYRLAWPPGIAPAQNQASNSIPVVMVVFDEFSGTSLWDARQEIDVELFPNFAQVADDGVWYRQATTVHGNTSSALPALLSGRYPPVGPQDSFIPQHHLFSTLIDEQGLDALVLEPLTRLCVSPRFPESRTRLAQAVPWNDFIRVTSAAYAYQLFPRDLKRWAPIVSKSWFGYGKRFVDHSMTRGVAHYPMDVDRAGQMQQFVSALSAEATSTLYFLHIVYPHVPWRMDAAGEDYVSSGTTWDFPLPPELSGAPASAEEIGRWPDDPLFVAQAQQRYLWQVQHADRFIGQLRRRLIEVGLYDRCLLVVMADHGVSFRPGDQRRGASAANQLDILSIPLLIKPPAAARQRQVDRDTSVESLDVFPSILDALAIPDPPPVDGTTLLSSPYKSRPSKRFIDGQGLRILPADYPQGTEKSEWPVLSGDLAAFIGGLADPQKLTGRPITDFAQGPEADCSIVRLPGALPEIEFAAGKTVYLPAEVDPHPPTGETRRLALVFDGRIVAVTRTWTDPALAGMFQFLLPADLHHQPVERAAIYVVEGDAQQPTLRRCR